LLSFGYRAGFGLFVKPITEANGWGREIISIALAVQNLFWGIIAFFAGGLADRFGNVKVVIAGTFLYALGMVLMPGVDSPWRLNASAGILVGAGIAGTSFGIILPAMARAVGPERQQWALGLGTAAGSIGQFAIVPVSQLLIDAYGWGPALNILAGSRSFLLLVMGFFVCGFHVAFITAHMPAFITDLGFDPKVGAWSISIIGLCNVFGAYLSGIISGKMAMRYLLVLIYSARAVVITLFILIPFSLVSVLVFSATMGFLWLATVPPTSGLVAVMFGTRYMAMLYGIVFLGHQVGSFIGVWLGGWLYDRSGSYDLVWWLGAALGVMAAILHWLMSERPVKRLAAENL
jgi:MFS family permease